VLLSSEVIANAVQHTGAPCAVLMRWTGVRLRVEVTDVGLELPAPRRGAEDAEGGRGLLLVASMAADWGSTPLVAGKVVWFEVEPSAPTAPTSSPYHSAGPRNGAQPCATKRTNRPHSLRPMVR
jgi:hypothetical protein